MTNPLLARHLLTERQLKDKISRGFLTTHVSELNAVLEGFPRGAITEITGPASSGRTTLLETALAAATSRGEYCALIDAADSFDPHSAAAAGVDLTRLLWVRCGGQADRALQVRRPAGACGRLGHHRARSRRDRPADGPQDPDLVVVPVPAGGRGYSGGDAGARARAVRACLRLAGGRNVAGEACLVGRPRGFPGACRRQRSKPGRRSRCASRRRGSRRARLPEASPCMRAFIFRTPPASSVTRLRKCAETFSPYLEEPAPGLLLFDLRGLARLFGTPHQIADAIRRQAPAETRIAIGGESDGCHGGGARPAWSDRHPARRGEGDAWESCRSNCSILRKRWRRLWLPGASAPSENLLRCPSEEWPSGSGPRA